MKLNKLAFAVALVAASTGANAAWDASGNQDQFTGTANELLFVAWDAAGTSTDSFSQDLGLLSDDFMANISSTSFSASVNVDAAFSNFAASADIRWAVLGFAGGIFGQANGGANSTMVTANANNGFDGAAMFNAANQWPAVINQNTDYSSNDAYFTNTPSQDLEGVIGTNFGAVYYSDITSAVGESAGFYLTDTFGGSDVFAGEWTFDGQAISYATASVNPDPVPVPAAAWLFGSALLGLAGAARRRKA